MAPRPRVLAWKTGMPTTGTITFLPSDQTLMELKRLGITHLVVGEAHVGVNATRVVTRLRREFPCRFDEPFRNGSYTVYRLLSECPP